MKLEIERKYLVVLAALPDLEPGAYLSQGYLSRQPAVRVRSSSTVLNGTSVNEGWITVKGKGKISRAEYEYPIPYADANEMIETLCEYSLAKIRRKILFEGNTWELDQFVGPHEPLWLAEIEIPREDFSFQKPVWVGREVTDDPRYANVALAEMRRAP